MASFVVVFPALPGDRDDLRRDGGAYCMCQALQRLERVGHCNRSGVLLHPAALDDRSSGTAGEHVGDKCMSVEPRSAQRHEEIPRLQRPAVGDNIANGTIGAVPLRRRAHCVSDPTERQVDRRHTARDFSRRDVNASLATSTSSNENV